MAMDEMSKKFCNVGNPRMEGPETMAESDLC